MIPRDARAAATDQPLERQRRAAALSDRKRALLERLRADPARSIDPDGVTQLRTGTAPEVVLIHPSGGQLLCYAELVRLLTPGSAVYGLEPDRATRSGAGGSLEEMAARHLDRLRRHRVQPALLVGWSFGGVLAYEMAGQLAEQSQPCQVAVLDGAPLPAEFPVRTPDAAETMYAFVEDTARSAGADPDTLPQVLARLPQETALATLRQFLETQGASLGNSVPELTDRLQLFTAIKTALDGYRSRRQIRPWLLWASDTPQDLRRYWRWVVPEPATAPAVTSNHYNLLRRPAVQAVADFLSQIVTTIQGDQA